MQELRDYLNNLSVDGQESFAKACGTSVGYLRKLISTGQNIGEGLAITIERESDRKITCEQLRPDVDWAYLRGSAKLRKAASAQA